MHTVGFFRAWTQALKTEGAIVGLRLRPVDMSFYDLFSELAAHLLEGSALLDRMLAEGADRAAIASEMSEAEHRADETTHRIIKRVNSTFVTPFDREDIYSLASSLDDVMDYMEETVDLVHLYGVDVLPAEFTEQVEVLRHAVETTADAMTRLRSMKRLEEYWIEINRLENQGDWIYRRLLADLFSGKFKTLEVLKIKDVVDALEKALDALESVANTVEQISVKET
jgi:predicted phosphate transport protein (TIGR00153 family)